MARAAADLGNRARLGDIAARTAAFTDGGRPLPARESYADVDLPYTLRALGFADEGNAGTPVFSPAVDGTPSGPSACSQANQ